jgi:hypothetical protein
MKATLRSHAVAAMMLLAPAAATFVATPASAQVDLTIQAMSLNSNMGLNPGATLRLDVQAPPGGRNADVVMGNSGVVVPIRENAPGRYSGSYVVRSGDRIDPLQLMTPRLQYGDYIYSRPFYYPPAFQALVMGNASGSTNANVPDTAGPRVVVLSPANGERVAQRGTVHVAARLNDRTGVERARLRINGRDVTSESQVVGNELHYHADLPIGRYTAEVLARDSNDNVSTRAWNFEVVPNRAAANR